MIDQNIINYIYFSVAAIIFISVMAYNITKVVKTTKAKWFEGKITEQDIELCKKEIFEKIFGIDGCFYCFVVFMASNIWFITLPCIFFIKVVFPFISKKFIDVVVREKPVVKITKELGGYDYRDGVKVVVEDVITK